MKNNPLQIITRASLHKNVFLSVLYCLFVLFSTIFTVFSAETLFTLKNNVDINIKQHITKRQIVAQFDKKTSDKYISDTVKKFKHTEHITNAYEIIQTVAVKQGNILKGNYYLDYPPIGGKLKITSGRGLRKNDSKVVILPEKIDDLDENKKTINEINSKSLIGKNLQFSDNAGNTLKMKVVGTFSAFDPTLDEKTLFVPYSDLKKYISVSYKKSNFELGNDTRRFMLVVDRAENTEAVADYINKHITSAYIEDAVINSDEYDTAILMIFLSLVLFSALSSLGFYMFLKNNIDRRTKELALYRSLGYKSKHLFNIIFYHHLILAVLSYAVGIGAVALLYNFFVNPYLDNLFGGTSMEMKLTINPVIIICIFAIMIFVIYIVCKKAVRRTEKIDLTVLLRS